MFTNFFYTLKEKKVPTGLRDPNSNPELLTQIRDKGVLSVLEEKFPRVRGIRETRILGRPTPEPKRELELKGEPVGEVEGEGMTHSIERSLEAIYMENPVKKIHAEAI